MESRPQSHFDTIKHELAVVLNNNESANLARTIDDINAEERRNWVLLTEPVDLNKEISQQVSYRFNNKKLDFIDSSDTAKFFRKQLPNTHEDIFGFIEKYFNDAGFKGISLKMAKKYFKENKEVYVSLFGKVKCAATCHNFYEMSATTVGYMERYRVYREDFSSIINRDVKKYLPIFSCATLYVISRTESGVKMEVKNELTFPVDKKTLKASLEYLEKTDPSFSLPFNFVCPDEVNEIPAPDIHFEKFKEMDAIEDPGKRAKAVNAIRGKDNIIAYEIFEKFKELRAIEDEEERAQAIAAIENEELKRKMCSYEDYEKFKEIHAIKNPEARMEAIQAIRDEERQRKIISMIGMKDFCFLFSDREKFWEIYEIKNLEVRARAIEAIEDEGARNKIIAEIKLKNLYAIKSEEERLQLIEEVLNAYSSFVQEQRKKVSPEEEKEISNIATYNQTKGKRRRILNPPEAQRRSELHLIDEIEKKEKVAEQPEAENVKPERKLGEPRVLASEPRKKKEKKPHWLLRALAPVFYRVYPADSHVSGSRYFNYQKINYDADGNPFDVIIKNRAEINKYFLNPVTMFAVFFGLPNQCAFGEKPTFKNLLLNFLGWEKNKTRNRSRINYALTPVTILVNFIISVLTLPHHLIKFFTEFLPALAAHAYRHLAKAAYKKSMQAGRKREGKKAFAYKLAYVLASAAGLFCDGIFCLGRAVTSPIRSAAAAWRFSLNFQKRQNESRLKKFARFLLGAFLFLLSTAITVTVYTFLFALVYNALPAMSIELPANILKAINAVTQAFSFTAKIGEAITFTLAPLVAATALIVGAGLTTIGSVVNESVDAVRGLWRTTNNQLPFKPLPRRKMQEVCQEQIQERMNNQNQIDNRYGVFFEKKLQKKHQKIIEQLLLKIDFFMAPFLHQEKFAAWIGETREREKALAPLSNPPLEIVTEFREALMGIDERKNGLNDGCDALIAAMLEKHPGFCERLKKVLASDVINDWYAAHVEAKVKGIGA